MHTGPYLGQTPLVQMDTQQNPSPTQAPKPFPHSPWQWICLQWVQVKLQDYTERPCPKKYLSNLVTTSPLLISGFLQCPPWHNLLRDLLVSPGLCPSLETTCRWTSRSSLEGPPRNEPRATAEDSSSSLAAPDQRVQRSC